MNSCKLYIIFILSYCIVFILLVLYSLFSQLQSPLFYSHNYKVLYSLLFIRLQQPNMSQLQVNLQDQRTAQTQPAHSQRITNIRLQKQLQFLRQSKLQYRVDKIQPIIRGGIAQRERKNEMGWGLTNLRVDNSEYSGREISYRIVIEGRQLPLENQLVLLIPKSYPFHEPLYYYNDKSLFYYNHKQTNPQTNRQTINLSQQNKPLISKDQNNSNLNIIKSQTPQKLTLTQQLTSAQPISQLMFWMPKYKILELVELIAIKINEKRTQQQIITKHFLPNLVASLNSPLIIFTIAVLVRVLVGLGSYSGKGDWPSLGDFQAHRNWMSITVTKPIAEWYYEPGPREDIWWRIDYPPVAAYLSYVFGSVYKYIQPQAMALQRGYQSPLLVTFMRLTVLLTQASFVFPALYLLSTHQSSTQSSISKKYSLLILFSLLLKPDLIAIDHGHFQYNCLIVGLILGAFYCLMNRNYYTCCVLFTIAVHSKQMAVYYALAFLAGLLGRVMADYRGTKVRVVREICVFGVIVLGVSLVIWMPFIVTGSAHYVLQAIFPVHRGLYQLKVQNFWCIGDVFIKWQTHFSKKSLMLICFTISTLLCIPSMLTMIFASSKKTLTIGFYTIAMTFFMFSYHVHEKSILLPLAMAPLLVQYLGPWFVSNLIISGMIGMYHLLKEDGQWMQYFVLIGFYVIFIESYNALTQDLRQYVLESDKNKTLSQRLHDKIFTANQNSLKFSIIRLTIYLIPLCLHLAQIFIPAPEKLEYLHHLLFAFYSFCFNAYSLVICNGVLVKYLVEKVGAKKSQGKEN